MKTLILLLAATLAGPTFAQQSIYNTDTTESTTSTPAVGTEAPTTSSDVSTMDEDTTSGAFSDRATGTSTDMNNTENTAPDMAAPAAAAPATTTTETTTSRTYREDTSDHQRKAGGFYIEPGIVGSRETADIKGRSIAGADTTGDSNGVAFDLKLGMHANEMIFLGADGRYERSRFENTSYNDTDASAWNWGPTLGFQAPFAGMRVWGTYIVDGNYDPDSGVGGTDLVFKDPYGWRAGVGFRLSSVSLNLEYEDLTYRTTDIQSIGTFAANNSTSVDFGQRGYALSLSFPFEL